MAVITSYSTLRTAVTDYLARSNLSGFTPNYVQNWEERFYRQTMNYGAWMEASLNSTIASGVIPVPAGYLTFKSVYIDGSPSTPLDRKLIHQLYSAYPRGYSTGRPCWIARDNTNFVFGPQPDSNYTVKGVYYAKPVLMRNFAADAAAHWIIVNAPDLALYGSLLEAEPFLKNDQRIIVWREFYTAALDAYRDLIKTEEQSGSPPQEILQ